MATKQTKAKAKPKTKSKTKPKSPAKKKTQANKTATAKPTFAFFGQGDAGYFEWFEMWIWFRDPVPKATQKQLVKIAPKLCARDAQWPHPNLLWASTGDQWIHQHLINEYGTKQQKATLKRILKHQEETGDPWDTGDEDEDGAFASGKDLKQFNTDIESWLVAMNAIQPILFAARREDGEAGGTRLGAWHTRSVGQFQSLVRPAIEPIANETKVADDRRRTPLEIAIHYGGEVSPALAAWVAAE